MDKQRTQHSYYEDFTDSHGFDNNSRDNTAVEEQANQLPFLRASKTVRRNHAEESYEKEVVEYTEQEEPKDPSVKSQITAKQNMLSNIDTGQSVFDRQLGRLRGKRVSRDSFIGSFPDFIVAREELHDLPHPSKLRVSMKSGARKEKQYDDSRVSSHLNQMKKRLNSWEGASEGVIKLIKERRDKAKLENVPPQMSESVVSQSGDLDLASQYYQEYSWDNQSVLDDDGLPKQDVGSDAFRTHVQDPIGLLLNSQDTSLASLDMIPHRRNLRAKKKMEDPDGQTLKRENRVHNHIAQLRRKLILGETSQPAFDIKPERPSIWEQYPMSPKEGTLAPDMMSETMHQYADFHMKPAPVNQTSNMRLCPWRTQGNQSDFDLNKEGSEQGRWLPSSAAARDVVPPKESVSVKWPILDLSQMDSGPFAKSGPHLDQASLWHCDSSDEYVSNTPSLRSQQEEE